MSTQLAPTVRITDTENHCVRRYEGDPADVLDKLRSEHRTGMLQVFINQGHICVVTFDTRIKPVDKSPV